MIGLITEGLVAASQRSLITQGLRSSPYAIAFYCAPYLLSLNLLANPILQITGLDNPTLLSLELYDNPSLQAVSVSNPELELIVQNNPAMLTRDC